MVERKPTPDELLRRVQVEERRGRRGRLKVFLGYASRVGKSFRMLDEGRRRRMRGEDVVVAATQAAGSAEIAQLLASLEIVPPARTVSNGKTFDVLDIPAVFRRRPAVCLVDELAYDNPPGSRHPQRWQDVEELLENGISVIAAVNLQHIRERQDDVARITGKRASTSVPEAFLREADEIEIVDAALDTLAERGAAPAEIRRLAELREMALLLAADVVDRQLLRYLEDHGIAQAWGAHERILVCLTPRSNARRMLESGLRNSRRFHGELLATYVRQPGADPRSQEAVENHLALAGRMGAATHVLEGPDPIQAILDFARVQRITQLFVGHSFAGGWLARFRDTPLDRLIAGAAGMDVRIFPHGEQP